MSVEHKTNVHILLSLTFSKFILYFCTKSFQFCLRLACVFGYFFVCLIHAPLRVVVLPSPTAPSAPPQEVHLVSLSSTSLKVSWVAPPAASRHGAIVRYTVSYQALAGEDTERHEVTDIGADATSYVLEGLEKWTEYQVWVRAHTDVGPGPESSPVRMRTREDGRLTPLLDQSLLGLLACVAWSCLSFFCFTVLNIFLCFLLITSELMRHYG